MSFFKVKHYVKSARIRSYSGPYFPIVRLKTEIYYLRQAITYVTVTSAQMSHIHFAVFHCVFEIGRFFASES